MTRASPTDSGKPGGWRQLARSGLFGIFKIHLTIVSYVFREVHGYRLRRLIKGRIQVIHSVFFIRFRESFPCVPRISLVSGVVMAFILIKRLLEKQNERLRCYQAKILKRLLVQCPVAIPEKLVMPTVVHFALQPERCIDGTPMLWKVANMFCELLPFKSLCM